MIEKASFETTRGNLQKMLKWISAPLEEQYDKAWLNIQEDEIHAVASMGQSAISYCTFGTPFVEDIDLFDDAEASGVQSLINIVDVQNYIDFVGGDRVEIAFFGNDDEDLCRKMRIDGDIRVDIYVPNSKADFESIQTGIVNTYNDENRWCKPSDGQTLDTRFRTKVKEFERIVQVTEFDDFTLSTFPVEIRDGEFVLNASDEDERNSIDGSLEANDVEGPDVSNSYSAGFAELFNNIGGEVWVDIEDSVPMNVVRESSDGAVVLRYTLLPAE